MNLASLVSSFSTVLGQVTTLVASDTIGKIEGVVKLGTTVFNLGKEIVEVVGEKDAGRLNAQLAELEIRVKAKSEKLDQSLDAIIAKGPKK